MKMKNIFTFILLFNFLVIFAQEETYVSDPEIEISNGKKYRSWNFEFYIGYDEYFKYENGESRHFGWVPRYNFYAPKKEYSISFSCPIELGVGSDLLNFSGSNGNNSSNALISITANLPLTIDFNTGANSTIYSTKPLGYFISAGFNNNYILSNFNYYTFGNIIKTGFRTKFNENILGLYISYYHPYLLKTDYKINEFGDVKLDVNKLGCFSIGLILNFEFFNKLNRINRKF
jgi:hypothetical protein